MPAKRKYVPKSNRRKRTIRRNSKPAQKFKFSKGPSDRDWETKFELI